jgi:hypothetical protein
MTREVKSHRKIAVRTQSTVMIEFTPFTGFDSIDSFDRSLRVPASFRASQVVDHGLLWSEMKVFSLIFLFAHTNVLLSLLFQYVNRAAGSVRTALKEPAKTKLASQDRFSYKAATWTEGSQGVKTEVTKLSKAGIL